MKYNLHILPRHSIQCRIFSRQYVNSAHQNIILVRRVIIILLPPILWGVFGWVFDKYMTPMFIKFCHYINQKSMVICKVSITEIQLLPSWSSSEFYLFQTWKSHIDGKRDINLWLFKYGKLNMQANRNLKLWYQLLKQ